jgi:hypothetical protein
MCPECSFSCRLIPIFCISCTCILPGRSAFTHSNVTSYRYNLLAIVHSINRLAVAITGYKLRTFSSAVLCTVESKRQLAKIAIRPRNFLRKFTDGWVSASKNGTDRRLSTETMRHPAVWHRGIWLAPHNQSTTFAPAASLPGSGSWTTSLRSTVSSRCCGVRSSITGSGKIMRLCIRSRGSSCIDITRIDL